MGKRKRKIGGEEISQLSKFAKMQRYLDVNKARRWLSKWAILVNSIWLFLVMLILYLNSNYLCLSDTVLVTLLTTTTYFQRKYLNLNSNQKK
ncbi:hypothetical protein J2T03_001163 [Chryseobacterium lathyri]|nr:hypothetical protein [Chryseobacterium lathyri]